MAQTRSYESVQRGSGGMIQKSSSNKFDNGDMELVKTGLFFKLNWSSSPSTTNQLFHLAIMGLSIFMGFRIDEILKPNRQSEAQPRLKILGATALAYIILHCSIHYYAIPPLHQH